MNKIFKQVPGKKLGRNVFDLSHERKFSCNMGDLVPIMCQEVVPGDSFRVNSEIMMRLAPMQAPIMHRVDVTTHFFYVPTRLVWEQKEFEKWITGGQPGDVTPEYPRFRFNSDNYDEPNLNSGSLADYLGLPLIPIVNSGTIDVSQLPFRAYQLIYNEFYRDQDLIPEVPISKESGIVENLGGDVAQLFFMRKRAWEKDYFTSARPWAQKGDEVTLPFAGEAPVKTKTSGSAPRLFSPGSNLQPGITDVKGININATNQAFWDETMNQSMYIDPNGSLTVDMSSVTATTINELRRAFQLQKWLERNARSGSRYTEMLQAHFGVRSSDARINRPEYLGGGRQAISVSEVLQTSQTSESSPQGEMSGHGISVGKSNRFNRFFEEHGFVIGLMSVLPRTAYQQGIPRQFQKFDRFEHYWPEFAHIGEQEIKLSELYLQGSETANKSTFGYAPRYSEYKYIPSTVHGDFKGNLNHWHMGRIFDDVPALNANFVTSNPTTRIFNVIDENVDKLWCHVYNNVKAARPMPVFGEPGLIDH